MLKRFFFLTLRVRAISRNQSGDSHSKSKPCNLYKSILQAHFRILLTACRLTLYKFLTTPQNLRNRANHTLHANQISAIDNVNFAHCAFIF